MSDQDPPRQVSDDELLEIVDRRETWMSLDGVNHTLRDALVRAAAVSSAGKSPYKLKRIATNIEVDHEQMLRLWRRLGIVPDNPRSQGESQ